MESLTGLDAAFLALETETSRLQVAGVLVLGPPAHEDPDPGGQLRGSPERSATQTFAAIRSVIEQRLGRGPRLRQRARRMAFGLQRPVWVEDPDIDLDRHVRRAALREPGGQAELHALVGEVMSRPLEWDRPLWEMVVVEGLAGGRTAVIARLHHAILDGEAGATAMAAFLDLDPGEGPRAAAESPSVTSIPRRVPAAPSAGGNPADPEPGPVPSSGSVWRYGAEAIARQAGEVLAAFRRGIDTVAELHAQNRELAAQGQAPPPALFQAPRTSLNGRVDGQRRFASLRMPLDDLELARGVPGEGGAHLARPTVNDVILCGVGGALLRYLESRGEEPPSSLVALVPVSTRRRQQPATGAPGHVGNDVSGMLIPLATTVGDPRERLAAITAATTTAKAQEVLAGGDFLETVARAVSPAVLSTLMRAAGASGLFDRMPPPFNVVVSSVVMPDVSLWWAGRPVVDVYPAGPVADGFGLNVTAMTYKGSVHFGLLAAPKLVPDVDELAELLDDSLAELVLVALAPGGSGPPAGQASASSRRPS